MLKDELQELGFTPNQAQVYLGLLELGQTKVGYLLKKTGFHRNIVYRALDDLIDRKLVFKISKRGVFYYELTDPTPLIQEIERKKQLAQAVVKELKSRHQVSHTEALVLTGDQGVKDMSEMVLQEGEDLYLIGANGAMLKNHPDLFDKFQRRLVKKNIRRYHLALEETRHTDFAKLPNLEVVYLPTEFSSPMVIWVFSGTVAQVLWEQPETIFLIKNKKIADDYRKYFDLLRRQIASI